MEDWWNLESRSCTAAREIGPAWLMGRHMSVITLVGLCSTSMAAPPATQGCGPVQIQALQSPSGLAGDGFGQAVAMSDQYVATLSPQVVPYGLVFVFERVGRERMGWRLDQEIPIQGSLPNMLQGSRLAMDDDTLLVGVPQDGQLGFLAGAVYVFLREPGTQPPWHLLQILVAPDGQHGDGFGSGLALSGDRLVVGAPAESSLALWNGAAYCFERRSGNQMAWEFRQKLVPQSPRVNARFGGTIALDGDLLAVGAPSSDFGAEDGGAIHLFEARGGAWAPTEVLTSPDVDVQDGFSGGLALSGEWLIASSPLDDDLGSQAGAVHVFRRRSGLWKHHQKILAEAGEALDGFGAFLAAEKDSFYVGTPFVDAAGLDSGAVYTFDLDQDSEHWIQTGRFVPSNLSDHDSLAPVAAHGGLVVAGAAKSSKPGAVYVFSARPPQGVSAYCTASAGAVADCAPALVTLGAPSASQGSTFRIWSRTVPGAQNGVLLYSGAGPARPVLAASGACLPTTNLKRKGLFWSGGTYGQCDGSFLLDWNEFIDDRDPDDSLLRTPGAVVHLQIAWFDPLVPGPLAWSDALAFQLCP